MTGQEASSTMSILDYSRVIRRFRVLIAGLVLASLLVTGIVCKLFTKLYEAKAVLLPPREESIGGGMSFGGGTGKRGEGGAGVALDLLGPKAVVTLQDVLNVFLTSRLMAERVVDQLNLMAYYGVESKTDAAEALRGEVEVTTGLFNSFEILARSKDPQMAADIANAYALDLDRLYKEHAMTSAKRNRLFIESRIAVKAKNLEDAEVALRDFQTRNRLPDAENQTFGAVSSAATFRGQIIELEVKLAVLKEYATPSHPMVNQLQAQMAELRRQLDKMEQDEAQGIANKRPPLSEKVFPAFAEAPTLVMEFVRLTRQVSAEEAVYGMLLGMLESAKLAEVRDLPVIQVMDPAIRPKVSSWPKTLQSMLVAGALSLVLGILLALFLDYLDRLRAIEKAGELVFADAAREFGESEGNGGRDSRLVGTGAVPQREVDRLPR